MATRRSTRNKRKNENEDEEQEEKKVATGGEKGVKEKKAPKAKKLKKETKQKESIPATQDQQSKNEDKEPEKSTDNNEKEVKTKRTTKGKKAAAPKEKKPKKEPELSVKQSWKMIEEHLQLAAPEQYEILMTKCKPVKQDYLEKIDEKMFDGNFEIPKDLQQSLLIHDMKAEVPAIDLYGYRQTLSDMDKLRKSYIFKVPDRDNVSTLIPLYHYEMDRTYFYLVVEAVSGAVLYLDYNDLVADAEGVIVAWNFKSYLSSLARNLSAGRIKYNGFPTNQFGFLGTDKILSMMPVRRKLKLDVYGANIRAAVKEALANPKENWKELPNKVKKVLPDVPAELQSDDVAFPDMTWYNPPTAKHSNKLLEDGHVVHMSNIAYGEKVFTAGKHYFEIRISSKSQISDIGLCSANFQNPNRTGCYQPHYFCVGFSGNTLRYTTYVHGIANSTEYFETKRLEKGDVVGVLLDMDNKTVKFYVNRVSDTPPNGILHEEQKKLLEFGDPANPDPRQESFIEQDPTPILPMKVYGVRAYASGGESALRFLPPAKLNNI